jgi:hypothetical protein
MPSGARGLQDREGKMFIVDLNIIVENHVRRSVHVDNKSFP